MRITVAGMSRFKDILEVELMVRKDSLYTTAEQKEEPNIMVKSGFHIWVDSKSLIKM